MSTKSLKKCPYIGDASDGPVSTLKGTIFMPDGPDSICERDHDALTVAVYKMQTETDSSGCEYIHLCEECYTEAVNHVEISTCDWCHADHVVVKSIRHWEEGNSGPVYEVCAPCREKYYKEMNELLANEPDIEYMDDDYYDDEPYPEYDMEEESERLMETDSTKPFNIVECNTVELPPTWDYAQPPT